MKKLLKIICSFIGHDMVYWDETIDHAAILVEFGRCERCKEFCFVSDVRGL